MFPALQLFQLKKRINSAFPKIAGTPCTAKGKTWKSNYEAPVILTSGVKKEVNSCVRLRLKYLNTIKAVDVFKGGNFHMGVYGDCSTIRQSEMQMMRHWTWFQLPTSLPSSPLLSFCLSLLSAR